MMDVKDLRKNNFVLRREDAKPKTKAEVLEEIKNEEIKQQNMLSVTPRRADREINISRKVEYNERWNIGNINTRRGPFDSSRLKNTTFRRGSTGSNVELRAEFSSWGRGRLAGVKEQEEERPNRFRVKKSPSEKEKAIATVKTMVTPRERSKSISRSNSSDNSLDREAVLPFNKSAAPDIDLDTAWMYTKPIIKEYASNVDLKEAKIHIREKFNASSVSMFIQVSLEWIIDRDSEKRKHVGQLFREMILDKIISIPKFMEGTKPFLEMMEYYEIKIPQVCLYLGEILACLLVDGVLNLEELLEVVEPAGCKKCAIFAKLIFAACKLMGPRRVLDIWRNSSLNWDSILPAKTDVSEFLQKHVISFILISQIQDAPIVENVIAEFDSKKTRNDLVKLFKRGASNEEIFGWIDANVGSHSSSKKFVRALTTALIESLVTTSADGSSVVVGEDFEKRLKEKVNIVHKYVDNSEKLELPCIFGMQSLCVEYQHPPGLLEQCFNVFYDQEVLSEDSFLEWEKDDDPEEQVGKGVCITSVRKFLKWLAEAEAEEPEQPE